MATFKLRGFGGMAPSSDPEYLADGMAEYARNCDTRFGVLRPFVQQITVGSANPGGTLYKFANSSTFITKTGDVDFVRGQIPNDDTERTYYTGDGVPKATDTSLTVRQLGVPKPTAAPVVTVNTVLSFTTDDALAAKKKAPATISTSVRDALSWQYKGMLDADLTDLRAIPERPWEYDVVRGGHVVNGGFIPDNATDVNLMSPSLYYRTDDVGLYVGLFVRAGVWILDKAKLNTALTAMPSPDTTAEEGAKLFTAEQVTTFVDAVDTYFKSKDKEIAPIVTRLKAAKLNFTGLVANPGTITSAVQGTVDAYYAKPEVVSAIASSVSAAAEMLVSNATGWQVNKGLTVASATGTINGYIFKQSDGTKAVNTADMKVWVVGQLTSVSVDARMDASSINSTASAICDALALDIAKLRSPDSGIPLSSVPTVNLPTSTGGSSVTQVMIDTQASMETMVKSIEALSKSLLDGVEKSIATIFDGNMGGVFPQGEAPIINSRAYVFTEVTDWGEESAPSPVSNIVEVDQNDTTKVVLPPAPGGRNLVKRRLYRSASGSTTSTFALQGEYDSNVLLVTDELPGDQLGESCPTFGWDEPPADLKGLAGMPNGIMLGFTGATLHACEPFAPYAWPAKYDIPLEYPIVSIAVAGQTAVITTTGVPYLVSGVDSASLSSEKLPFSQACIAKRSTVAIGGSVIYASPDGLVAVEGLNVTVFTAALLTKEDWNKYNPKDMFAAEYEGRYYAFYSNSPTGSGCLIFDLATKTLVDHSGVANAVYSDKATDTLYSLYSSNINNFMPTVGLNMMVVWKSKLFRGPKQFPLAWLHVDANFGSVKIDIFADGALWYSVSVTTKEPVRLPPGRFTEWQFRVTTDVHVRSVVLASTSEELKAVG